MVDTHIKRCNGYEVPQRAKYREATCGVRKTEHHTGKKESSCRIGGKERLRCKAHSGAAVGRRVVNAHPEVASMRNVLRKQLHHCFYRKCR